MCGIVGVAGEAAHGMPRSRVEGALALMSHRGPDGSGIWSGAGVMLGHVRLAIVDPDPRSSQPMERGGLVITYNGEIYNHRTLREELQSRGHVFRTGSDTEVLLAAWHEWGARCLDRLEGMFAFGIWDRGSRTLYLARDRYGEKPLFLMDGHGGIRFASELPPLVHLLDGPHEEDPRAIGLYFGLSYVPPPLTPLKGVRQLEPGQVAEWRDGRLLTRRYYAVRPRRALMEGKSAGRAPGGYREACTHLRRLMERSIEERVKSADVPVATLLSGGVDSSIVTVLASRRAPYVMSAYTVCYPNDPEFDECAYARTLCENATNLVHRPVEATEEALAGFAEHTVRRLGEPFGDSSLIVTAWVCAHVEEKVILGGDGADEVFGGYAVYPAIRWGGKLPRCLVRAARRLFGSLNPHGLDRRISRAAVLFSQHLREDPVEAYLSWRIYMDEERLVALGLDVSGYETLRERLHALWDEARSNGGMRVVDMRFNLAGDMLRKIDYGSMLFSKEMRAPYLDRDVVEWGLALPVRFLEGRLGWVRKRILRDTFSDLLPPSIRSRGKMGFLVPLRKWFRSGAFRDRVEAVIEGGKIAERREARRLLREHVSGARDHSVFLWLMWVYSEWKDNLRCWACPPA